MGNIRHEDTKVGQKVCIEAKVKGAGIRKAGQTLKETKEIKTSVWGREMSNLVKDQICTSRYLAKKPLGYPAILSI
jgi:hypothetical protein